jgi:hypothetical protein
VPREFVHAPKERKRWGIPSVGFRLLIPDAIEIVPDPKQDLQFHAIEQRAPTGRRIGELKISIINQQLIMDRSGVLHELVGNAAAELVHAPAAGQVDEQVRHLEIGEAYCADVVLSVDAEGRRPPLLPYATVMAIGHTDFMLPAALFVLVRSAESRWEAAEEIIGSLTFL